MNTATTITRMRNGSPRVRSTILNAMDSNQPRLYTATSDTLIAIMSAMVAVAKPTSTDTRDPYTRCAHRSWPTSSVPSRCALLGWVNGALVSAGLLCATTGASTASNSTKATSPNPIRADPGIGALWGAVMRQS